MAKRSKRPLLDPRLVKALGHPLRVEILERLTERVASPNELKDEFDQPLSHVSYHVRILEKYDSIELVDQQQRRGATEHFYRATAQAFLGNPALRKVPSIFRRAVTGASLTSLMDKAVRALERGHLDKDGATFTWLPIALDEQGVQEVAGVCQTATDELLAVEKRARRRLGKSKGEAASYVVGVMAFEAAG